MCVEFTSPEACPACGSHGRFDAAPDLLAALQRIVDAYRESRGEVFGEDIKIAEAAIAKATGE